MSMRHDIPTHLTAPDRPILGLTARQLLVLTAGVFLLVGVVRQPHLPLPARLVEGAVTLALAVVVALVQPHGRSLLTWGRLALVHRIGPRALAWTPRAGAGARSRGAQDRVTPRRPPHLRGLLRPPVPSPAPASPPPRETTTTARRRHAVQAQPFVPADIAAAVVTFADGRRCAVLECSGPTTTLLDRDALAVLHAQYHSVLVGLQVPLQIVVVSAPADLRRHSALRAARLASLPLALRRLESSDLAYMQRAAHHLGAVDHRMFVVIAVPARTGGERAGSGSPARVGATLPWRRRADTTPLDDARAAQALAERCEQVATALRSAGVHAWRLDTAALRALWYHHLCPRSALVQPLDAAHGVPAVTRTLTVDAEQRVTQPGGVYV